MKKKKEKLKKEELVLGDKIRDVKVNEKQHFLLFVSMLIFVNVILVLSVIFVLSYLKDWFTWVICFTILIVCFWLSLKKYRETNHFNTCEIYNNAIVINSIWFNLKIALKDISEINVKTSKLDKLFKLNTKSLEIKILGQKRKKTYNTFY